MTNEFLVSKDNITQIFWYDNLYYSTDHLEKMDISEVKVCQIKN